MKIMVTGAAGFIGMHTCIALINKGYEVCGIDNLMNLKRWFLAVDTCIKNLLESYSVSSSKQLDHYRLFRA